MTPEDTVAVDTVTATLRAMGESARNVATILHVAAEIRGGEPGEDNDAAVTLLVRHAETIVIELRRQIRRFPPLP